MNDEEEDFTTSKTPTLRKKVSSPKQKLSRPCLKWDAICLPFQAHFSYSNLH